MNEVHEHGYTNLPNTTRDIANAQRPAEPLSLLPTYPETRILTQTNALCLHTTLDPETHSIHEHVGFHSYLG
jgi:hypothetical protein